MELHVQQPVKANGLQISHLSNANEEYNLKLNLLNLIYKSNSHNTSLNNNNINNIVA